MIRLTATEPPSEYLSCQPRTVNIIRGRLPTIRAIRGPQVTVAGMSQRGSWGSTKEEEGRGPTILVVHLFHVINSVSIICIGLGTVIVSLVSWFTSSATFNIAHLYT